MTTLLRDYVRRFWWIWLIGSILYGVMVGLVLPVKFNESIVKMLQKSRELVSQTQFLILMLLSATMGLFPLFTNLANGSVIRVLLTMPVTFKEIGRAWWWAAVGIPILALGATTVLVWAAAALIFAVALTLGNEPLSASIDFRYWLANAVLVGVAFLLFTGIPPLGSARSAETRLRGWFCAILLISLYLLHAGLPQMGIHMFDVHSIAEDPFRVPTVCWKASIALGVLLTALGWYRAEALAKEYAAAPNRFLAAPRKSTKPSRCGEGPGGLRFLLQLVLGNMLLCELFFAAGFTAMVLVLEALLAGAQAATHNYPLYVKQNDPFVVQFAGFQCMSLIAIPVMQIRCVRAMPISTAKLAASLVLTPLVSLIGALYVTRLCLSAAFHVPLGPFVALNWQSNLLPIALVATVIPTLAWRGQGKWPVLTMAVGMMACMYGTGFVDAHFTPWSCASISALLVCASLIATKVALDRSSHA